MTVHDYYLFVAVNVSCPDIWRSMCVLICLRLIQSIVFSVSILDSLVTALAKLTLVAVTCIEASSCCCILPLWDPVCGCVCGCSDSFTSCLLCKPKVYSPDEVDSLVNAIDGHITRNKNLFEENQGTRTFIGNPMNK